MFGLEKSHWVTIGTTAVATLVLIIGWGVNSDLSAGRDYENKRREIKLAYLIDAYDKLALASNREPVNGEYARMLESAVAKIQLFGSVEEIGLLHSFLDQWAATEKSLGRPVGALDPLLFALRNTLRKEIGLSQVSSRIHWLRPEGDGPKLPR